MNEPHNYCPLTYCSAQCVRSMALLLVLYTTSTVHNVPTTLGFPYSFAGRSSHPARHNWLMLLIGNLQTHVFIPAPALLPANELRLGVKLGWEDFQVHCRSFLTFWQGLVAEFPPALPGLVHHFPLCLVICISNKYSAWNTRVYSNPSCFTGLSSCSITSIQYNDTSSNIKIAKTPANAA
jgi:hypothetical protein